MMEHSQEFTFSSLLSWWGDVHAKGTSICALTGPPLSYGFPVNWLTFLSLLLYFRCEMSPKASGTSWGYYSKVSKKDWIIGINPSEELIDKMGN